MEGRNAVKETWQQNLARGLRNEPWVDVHSIKIIRNTAVPVIKFKTRESEGKAAVNVDISFESPGHRGLQSNKLIGELMQVFPNLLRPLVLVLKTFLSRKSLCEAFTGGISSYALLLITARFLQELNDSEITDVGAVLLGLLKFVGEDFDPRCTGISIGKRCYFPRSPPIGQIDESATMNPIFIPFKFDPLFIEDPLTPGNNVGRNCFRILQIQRIFMEAYTGIVDILKKSEKDGVAYPILERLVDN